MRYCSTWLRSLLCYIKKSVIEEFDIRVFHCVSFMIYTYVRIESIEYTSQYTILHVRMYICMYVHYPFQGVVLSACDTMLKAALSIPRVESKLFPAEVRALSQSVKIYVCIYI